MTQLFLSKERISLDSCSVSDKGVKLLTQTHMEKLQTLMLSSSCRT